jgi:hypothetical protein
VKHGDYTKANNYGSAKTLYHVATIFHPRKAVQRKYNNVNERLPVEK